MNNAAIIMANKPIHKKYFVPKIIKSNLLNLTNVLFEHIQKLYNTFSDKLYDKSWMRRGYMKEYNRWFLIRLDELKTIQQKYFQHYPYYYHLLERFAMLLKQADREKFKERRSIDFHLMQSVRTLFNLVRQQLNTIP